MVVVPLLVGVADLAVAFEVGFDEVEVEALQVLGLGERGSEFLELRLASDDEHDGLQDLVDPAAHVDNLVKFVVGDLADVLLLEFFDSVAGGLFELLGLLELLVALVQKVERIGAGLLDLVLDHDLGLEDDGRFGFQLLGFFGLQVRVVL